MQQIKALKRNKKTFEAALERAIRLKNEMRETAAAQSTESMRAAGPSTPVTAPTDDELFEAFTVADISGVTERFADTPQVEAIIRNDLRPAFLIQDDQIQFDSTEGFEHLDLIRKHLNTLNQRCRSVGRINLWGSNRAFAGTAWMIDEKIAVTNRHVAQLFTESVWPSGWTFAQDAFDRNIRAELDTVVQMDTNDSRNASIDEILWIADHNGPDIAFVRINKPTDVALDPLTNAAEPDLPIAVVGYPARDPRDNDPVLIERFFKGEFDVKRFAPGTIMPGAQTPWALAHDASTLGNNSGSAVIDLASGKAIALHFAGAAGSRNSAVPMETVVAALRQVKRIYPVVESFDAMGEAEKAEEESIASDFGDRDGYQPWFLGGTPVALPSVGHWAEDLAPLLSNPKDTELRYRHFSVFQSKSRRLPLLTAVNIDGNNLFRIPRKGRWRLDRRIGHEHQVGNVLYRRNPLDRGHMVRRLDPCWAPRDASKEIVEQAQSDTFHYTNSVPQHEDLNQRDWVGLEDYILDAAEKFDFRVSVFTGPVFREDDRPLHRQKGAEDIKIPREFWKVAIMRRKDTGAFSATGYVLSHGEMLQNLTEAQFVLGKYKTYQVPISLIERATGLDFGNLKKADPMNTDHLQEAAFHDTAKPIRSTDDVILE